MGNHTSDPSRHVSILTLWFSQGNQQLLCACEYFVANCAWFIEPPDKDQRTGVYKMQFNNDHIYALNTFFHPSTQKFNNFGSSKKLNIYIIQMPVQIKQRVRKKHFHKLDGFWTRSVPSYRMLLSSQFGVLMSTLKL